MKKQHLALILAFCMALTLFSVSVPAQTPDMTAMQAAELLDVEGDVYYLRTAEDFDAIRDNPEATYYMETDIDLSNDGQWIPIAEFSGVLDGQGHTVTLKGAAGSNICGIFDQLSGTVRNLIADVEINSPNAQTVGGLASRLVGSTLECCGVVGSVTGAVYVGGIAGQVNGGSTSCITRNCYTIVDVHGVTTFTRTLQEAGVGGLFGFAWSAGASTCYAAAKDGGLTSAGGSAYIGAITGLTNVGAFSKCYYNNYNVITNPYAGDQSRYRVSGGGNKSTRAMKTASTYEGWDFENIWDIDPNINDGYPYLRCQVRTAPEPEPSSPPYRVNSITLRNGNEQLSAIPESEFLATVSITNLASDGNGILCLASYTTGGQYNGLLYVGARDLPVGATFELTLPVDNRSGGIGQLNAFLISSFGEMVPVGNIVSYPS